MPTLDFPTFPPSQPPTPPVQPALNSTVPESAFLPNVDTPATRDIHQPRTSDDEVNLHPDLAHQLGFLQLRAIDYSILYDRHLVTPQAIVHLTTLGPYDLLDMFHTHQILTPGFFQFIKTLVQIRSRDV